MNAFTVDPTPPPLGGERANAKRKSKIPCLLAALISLGAGGALLITGGLVAIGFAAETGIIPDTKVRKGNELSQRAMRQIREIGALPIGETIQYFYSAGLFSFKADGNFFTENRVVSYETVGEDVWIFESMYPEINLIEFNESNTFFDDSTITIHTDDNDSFYLLVSNEEGLDEVFYDELVFRWESNREAAK